MKPSRGPTWQPDTITHETVFASSWKAGAMLARATRGRPKQGGWGGTVQVRHDRAATRPRSGGNRARVYKRFETLVSYLRELGIVQFEWTPRSTTPSAPLSARSRRSNATTRPPGVTDEGRAPGAAYDKWFRAEIGAALVEADDPATVKVAHADVAAAAPAGQGRD